MSAVHHKLILTDGTETILPERPSIPEVQRLIGCDTLDTVALRHGSFMYVDDTGMIDGKPVNEKATARYWKKCKPGTIHQIHGNVVIINDRVEV